MTPKTVIVNGQRAVITTDDANRYARRKIKEALGLPMNSVKTKTKGA